MKKDLNNPDIILRQVRHILKTPEGYPITKRAREIMSGIRNIQRLYKISCIAHATPDETEEWLNGYNKAMVDILSGFNL